VPVLLNVHQSTVPGVVPEADLQVAFGVCAIANIEFSWFPPQDVVGYGHRSVAIVKKRLDEKRSSRSSLVI
jgi:hypothetical protein